jgi:hypothetical protein
MDTPINVHEQMLVNLRKALDTQRKLETTASYEPTAYLRDEMDMYLGYAVQFAAIATAQAAERQATALERIAEYFEGAMQ